MTEQRLRRWKRLRRRREEALAEDIVWALNPKLEAALARAERQANKKRKHGRQSTQTSLS